MRIFINIEIINLIISDFINNLELKLLGFDLIRIKYY
jgi:hypothetical protein